MSARHPKVSAALPLALCVAIALGSAHVDALSPAMPHVARHARAGHVAAYARLPHSAGPAGSVAVTSCADDGGGGTLRSVVASAPEGATVDLSGLACSTITLTQGAIAIAQDDLTLHGPSNRVFIIDGNYTDAVIAAYGAGTLAIDHVAIIDGVYAGTAPYGGAGGCVFANGSVSLDTVTIGNCVAGDQDLPGYGGGVYAAGGITMSSSTVTASTATQTGGGLMAGGVIYIANSTISGNYSYSVGGGVASIGSLLALSSTITSNGAYAGGGGIFLAGDNAPGMYSTIVANNTRYSEAYYAADIGSPFNALAIIGGNLIVNTSDISVPGDTMNVDPMLGPLADNGGLTLTHALLSGSPAIEAGDNVEMRQYDQRGPGFTRVFGPNADIGAFEFQPLPDDIFASGFDPG